MLLMGLLINVIAVAVAAYILPGIHVDGWMSALAVAVVLGIVNAFIKPIVTLLTLPLTILTLGLFLIVINIALVFLVAAIVPGFRVDGWLSALLFSIVVSVVGSVLQGLTKS